MRTSSTWLGLFAKTRVASCVAIALITLISGGISRAGVVTIDLTGYTGLNAGLASGGRVQISGFVPGATNRLDIMNGFNTFVGLVSGLSLQAGGGGFATGNPDATPINFGPGALIDATAGGGAFNATLVSPVFRAGSKYSPAFGPNSFLGFKDSLGRFGYIEVTWDGVNSFELISAAYESTPGVAIQTPDGSGAVPEPTSMAIFGLGTLGMAYRARRKAKARAKA